MAGSLRPRAPSALNILPYNVAMSLSESNDIEADPRLLEALASLNQIGASINQIAPGEEVNVEAVLRLIVERATQVVPNASAVIYTFDPELNSFDSDSRISAGEWLDAISGDAPRSDGLGRRAIEQRRRVISYEETDLDIHPVLVQAGARVVICYPLVVAEQAVGALYIYLHEDRPFSRLEQLMLDNFVNQAAIAIYQVRRMTSVRRDLARKDEELKHLRRMGLLISSRRSLEETLEVILQSALEESHAQYGIFRLVDRGGQNLITRALAGEHLTRPQVEALPVDLKSITGWVAVNREPVYIPDLRAEPWRQIYYPFDTGLEMRSELAVPLISASGRLEGVINLESPLVGAFTEQDSHMLQALANQAIIAIQEVRLLDALQEAAELLLARPCQQVLERLVELACDLLNAASSAIWTLEDDQLKLSASSGAHQHDPYLPLHESLAGLAILNRTLMVSDDVRIDPRFRRPDLAQAQDWSRALVMPLLTSAGRQPVGVLSVYSPSNDAGRFAETEWDKKVLTCLSQYAALAIQNAAHQEELRASQEQRSVAETFAAVGDIAANLLHHLNNKVGTIPVRIQGIQDKCKPVLANNPYLANNLLEIERSASEAMETVRENLSHLRPIHLGEVDVASCVREAVESANLPVGIQVQLSGLERLPQIVAAQRNLILVFANLLENASNAMLGSGTIQIRGARRGGWVEVAVSDSGSGIPSELQDRIFELNFSASQRGSTRPGKLGFGLWWVKTVMTRLGGSVSVESDGQHGSTFRLKLPVARRIPASQEGSHE